MANASRGCFLTVSPSGEGVGNAGTDEDFAVTKETNSMLAHSDAKTMAKAMREALADRDMTISHSEALEIVARQFGLATWNILSAKIDAPAVRQDGLLTVEVIDPFSNHIRFMALIVA